MVGFKNPDEEDTQQPTGVSDSMPETPASKTPEDASLQERVTGKVKPFFNMFKILKRPINPTT